MSQGNMTQQNPLAEELAGVLIAARNVVNGNYSSCEYPEVSFICIEVILTYHLGITFTLLFYDTLLMFPKEVCTLYLLCSVSF
jgi:hypothetical protein